MSTMINRLQEMDWEQAYASLNKKGYVLLPSILSTAASSALKKLYQVPNVPFRKVVQMERYRFGKGTYKYFDYPLPEPIQLLREAIYHYLAPIANLWHNQLNGAPANSITPYYPSALEAFLKSCRGQGQTKPTPLILEYSIGDYNTMHQDLYGEIYFPFQAVLFLSSPGKETGIDPTKDGTHDGNFDYIGGEFVLLEQLPRAQSRATVLKPQKGDILLMATGHRPALRSNNHNGLKNRYYKINMRHGVSEITGGQRHTLGIIFHDGAS